MATSKKQSYTGKTSRTSGKKTKKSSVNSFHSEIRLLIFLAISVLLMVSNLGKGGLLGNAISKFCFGTIGLLAYLFPVFLFFTAAILIFNKSNPLIYKKTLAATVFFIFLCALMQLLTEGYSKNTSLGDYFTSCADFHTGGGVIGGMICMMVSSAFGELGSYVVIFFVLIICLILITQKSLLGFLSEMTGSLGSAVKGRRERYYLEYQSEIELKKEIREEKRRRRKEKRLRELEESLEEEREWKTAGRRYDYEDDYLYGENVPFMANTLLKDSIPQTPKQETDHIPPATVKTKSRKTSRMEKEESFRSMETEMEAAMNEDDFQIETMRTRQGQIEFRIQRAVPEADREKETDFSMPPSKIQTVPEDHGKNNTDMPSGQTVPLKEENNNFQTETRKLSQESAQSGILNKPEYQFPPVSLLAQGSKEQNGDSDEELRRTAQKLQDTLRNFGVNATVTNVSCGPTVTRYELLPEMGVKVSRIVNLSDDIKLNLAASDIRIEAPIPGKAAVGIEVPNKENSAVMLRDLIQSAEFTKASSRISFAVGKDIGGKTVVTDIAKMPHLLIAGATGSGKSVCINTIIISLLYKAKPEEVKMIMIDPKVVELSVYNGIPHLLIPVVTDPKKAAGALNWAVSEMMARYNTFAEYGVRNISEYNRKIKNSFSAENEPVTEPMPQIVIIVDELADLMMIAPGEVESAICRIAQLARAAGIHLIIATQRPSVNVITGVIKANMPSRIAFAVSSGVDSRTILDMNGAEKLLGKGDMLFYPQGYPKPVRLQGAYISDEEVSSVVQFLAGQNPSVQYNAQVEQQVSASASVSAADGTAERDVYFEEAGRTIIQKEKASIGMLQRNLRIGFNRAARIMEQLCDAGVVGPEEGTKPRKVLMTIEEFENLL